MSYEIIPIEERFIAGFRQAVDVVAREKRFLSFLEAPPLEQAREYVLSNIKENYPHFVAVDKGEVIGWCDAVSSRMRAVHARVATLGIGVLPSFRGKGIGTKLLQKTIEASFEFGFTRIALTVREKNERAIALYKKHSFEIEGMLRQDSFVDGQYENSYMMALIKPSKEP